MDIVFIVAFIAALFLVIGCAEPLADRLRMPYSAMLAVIGILIGGGAAFFLHTGFTDALNPVSEAILSLPIQSSLFLYVLLPTLLFQATLEMNLRRMADDWVPILVMAVVAVVVATFAVGYALWYAGALPLLACLLIGSIVSTTDPSAVVSIFRSLAAPRRLAPDHRGREPAERCRCDRAVRPVHGIRDGGRPRPRYPRGGVPFPDADAGRRRGRLCAGAAGGLADGLVRGL